MKSTLWHRWRWPGLVFVIGFSLINQSTNFLNTTLFKADVSSRLDNLYQFYQSRFIHIDNEVQDLSEKLAYSCDDNDISLLRKTVEKSSAIQLIEITNLSNHCSIYGHGVRLIKNYTPIEQEADTNTKINGQLGDTLFSIEPYDNHRLKISYALPRGLVTVITEPFQNVFTDSETCSGCLAMYLTSGEHSLPIYPKDSVNTYQFIAAKRFSPIYKIKIFATENGIAKLVGNDIIIIQLLLLSLLLTFCLVLRFRNNEAGNLRDMIQKGLKRNQFTPYYQPIINTQLNKMVGCEVLVRWKLENGDLLSPDHFVPTAEHTGQIFEITESLIRQVFCQLSSNKGRAIGGIVSINAMPTQLENPAFSQWVIDLLQTHQLDAKRLSFEVTERTPFNNMELAKQSLGLLCEHGITIKLDDAGTGYGGFSYLQSLPIGCLKIDKMFIDTIGTEDIKTKILESIILFAQHAGLKIIAEGVENAQQVEYLKNRGVYLIQGYYFAQPMPFNALLEYMKNAEHPQTASPIEPVTSVA